MKSYPSYKDSGVEWIGEIPNDWSFGEMKYQLSNNDGGVWGKDVEKDDNETIVIRSTEITIDGNWNLTNPMKRKLDEDEIKKCKLFKGDIVITKSSGSPNHIGKSVIVNENVENLNCCYSNFVQRIRFRKYNPKLYHYILNSYVVREQYRYLTQSTTGLGNLNGSTLNEVQLPFIPLPEQKQIVSFLDTKTQKIDELIEKTEQKIKLLKEKRTSLINHCVTKGLNPNVEMKDSGVEWIGEIPNHWGVKLLKFVFNSIREKSETGEEELLSVLIKKGVVRRRDFLGEDSDNLTRSESLVGYIHCSKGNLVNNIMKMGFYCLGISDYDGIVSPGYSVFEMIDNNDYPKYWDYLLKTEIYVSEYRKRSKGIQESRMRLYDDYFLSIHSLYPPKTEQTKIIEHLDEQTQKIDSTIEKETQRIELLKEYRQSLISEVVTGKVDVREWNG